MNSQMGKDVKLYRNVIIRNSTVGSHCIFGDDSFITDSQIGERCTIERRGMIFNSELGDYSYTGYNTIVKHIRIGKFCSISWNVSIGGGEHQFHQISTHPFPYISKYGFVDNAFETSYFKSSLEIGNDVWIGCNTCILRDLKIGDGAVIGAGSVVTKDIPSYAIAVGNPARVIGYCFDESIIAKLLEWQWWDWPEESIKRILPLFHQEMNAEIVTTIDAVFHELDR